MPTNDVIINNAIPNSQSIYWNRFDLYPKIQEISFVGDAEEIEVNIKSGYEWIKAIGKTETIFLTNDTDKLQLECYNLESLTEANYQAQIKFKFIRIDGTYSFKTIYINLSLSQANQLSTDKSVYNLNFNRETNTLSGDKNVGIINNNDSVALKFWQNQNIFAAAENFTTSFQLQEDLANTFITNPNLPNDGLVKIPSKILKQTGEFISGFNINLYLTDGGISIFPESLSFEVFKGTSEKSAILNVINAGNNFTVTCPDWLVLSQNSGNSDANITVTTKTDSTNIGIYNGIIRFTYNGKHKDIPVTLDLKQFIVVGDSDFCLDLPPIQIFKKTDGANLVRITLTAIYEVMGVVKNFSYVYSVPYFNGIAEFELGEKLYRNFPRFKEHFFDSAEAIFMKKIISSIKVEEMNFAREVLFVETVSNIKLFPGKKPKAFPLLSNFLHRKKNKNAVIFTSEVLGDEVKVKKTSESVVQNTLQFGTSTINFYGLPKTFNQIDVQWENQNLVPEWFTLTGEFKMSPEFNHVYARNIFNAQNEKYDTTKVKTLTVNTGVFLASEKLLITEMIESRLSFAKIEGKIYRCFNITKKNTEIDSSEELVSRELEFLIVEE